jgi:hypothetical protein
MMMNSHTRQMLRRPFCEVHGDYKEAKANLATAIAADDHEDISFYCAAYMHKRMSLSLIARSSALVPYHSFRFL